MLLAAILLTKCMVSKLTEINKYGGHTWDIKLDSLFHLFIHGTTEKTFIVEFKEWRWINNKTHFSFVSNKNLKWTIETSFQKTFDFFQQHPDYTWTENQMNSKLNQALDLLSSEIENEGDEEVEERKTLDNGQEIPSLDLDWDYGTFRSMSEDGGDPNVAFNRGKFAEQYNDVQGAIDDYSNAIKYKPDFREAYLRRAICYQHLNELEKAIADYKAALQFFGSTADLNAQLGIVHTMLKRNEESLKYFDEAIKLDSTNPKVYYLRGKVKVALTQLESALYDFTKCLEITPDDRNALEQRGIVRGELADYENSLLDFNRMIELDKNDGQAYFNRAVTFYSLKDKERSKQDFRTASQLGIKAADELIREVDK